MIYFLFVVCLLWAVASSYFLVRATRRLLQFDNFVEEVVVEMDDYLQFLAEKTSRGLLLDHPEVIEFHKTTVDTKKKILLKLEECFSVSGKDGKRKV